MGSEKKKKKDIKDKSRTKNVDSEDVVQHNTKDIVLLNSNFVITEPDNVLKKSKKKKKKKNDTFSKLEDSSDKLRMNSTPECDDENRKYPENGSENKRAKRKRTKSEVEESEHVARSYKKRRKHRHDSQSDDEPVNIDSVKQTPRSGPECSAVKRREHCISENSDSNDDIKDDLEHHDRDSVRLVDDDDNVDFEDADDSVDFEDDNIRDNLEHNDKDSVRLVDDDDNIDFEDDDYLIPSKNKINKTLNYSSDDSDDDWFKGLPIIPNFSTYMEQNPSTGHNKLTFRVVKKATKTYEEMLYKFPPGVGVPDDKIEEIPEKYNYWKQQQKIFEESEQFSMEDVAEEIESKIDVLCDYFERFESEQLTEEELKMTKRPDMTGLFLPTPESIKFLEHLEIKVTWPTCRLHRLSLQYPNEEALRLAMRQRNIELNKKGFSTNEIQILLSNWKKFQEEYKFYDLRPLLQVRTHRLRRLQDGEIEFTRWKYLSGQTQVAFGLYLARGLKERTAFQAISSLKRSMMHIEECGDYVLKHVLLTARDIARLEYMLRKFGNCFEAMVAVLGGINRSSYITRFYSFIWQRNIKLRCGPWTEAEKERLKLGLLTECGVSSLSEAIEKRHFPTMKLIPYVKTRSRQAIRLYMRQLELGNVYFNSVGHKFKQEYWIKLIDLVYQSDYEEHSHIPWEEMVEQFPGIDKYIVKKAFMDLYCKVPLTIRQKSFEAVKQYLYSYVRITYEDRITPQEQLEQNSKQLARQKYDSEDSVEIKEESEDCTDRSRLR